MHVLPRINKSMLSNLKLLLRSDIELVLFYFSSKWNKSLGSPNLLSSYVHCIWSTMEEY